MKLIIIGIIGLMIVSYLSGCTYSTDNPNTISNTTSVTQLIFNNSLYTTAPQDRYQLNRVSLEGDQLIFSVSYNGGCKNHTFLLISPTQFDSSLPPQTTLLLSHDSHQDPCEAYITEELTYDITPFQEKVSSGSIRIWIKGHNESFLYDWI